MKTCDYCGRENTDDAAHCRECGTRFAPEDDPQLFKSPERVATVKKIISGVIICVVGLFAMLLAWLFMDSGPFDIGCYAIAFIATLSGGLRICRGLADRDKQRTTEEIGFEALTHARKLEADGGVQEALVVYQQIVQQYPDSNPGRNAKKSIKILSHQ